MRLFTARHQNTAVVILQQVLITLSVGRHTMAYLFNVQPVRGWRFLEALNAIYIVARLIAASFHKRGQISRIRRLTITWNADEQDVTSDCGRSRSHSISGILS